MMDKTECYFISHCEDDCGLGSFNYQCPSCQNHQTDYDIWNKQDDIWAGEKHNFECESCSAELIVSYDKDNYVYECHKM